MAFKRKTYKGVYEDTNEHYVCDTTEDVCTSRHICNKRGASRWAAESRPGRRTL